MQLAAREGRLEEISRIHGAVRLARTDQSVDFIDKENDLTIGLFNLFEDGFEAFFKLAAIFRPRDQRSHIQCQEPFIANTFGHIAANDAHSQTFGNGGFPDAGLTDQ